MTWLSANTPYYFKPAVVNGNVYISGDNIAISPALFAYYYATQEMGETDVRVISIGSTNELADKINTKASMLDWAERITTLSAPVKKHTMDYMVHQLLSLTGEQLNKFEIDKTRDWENEFYTTTGRLAMLKDLSNELIFAKRDQIEAQIDMLVAEKFTTPNGCDNKPN